MNLTTAWTSLRSHDTQVQAYRSTKRFNVIPAGRRCLSEGTLVCTPFGPKRIETLKPGDSVIGYDNGPQVTTITEVHNNGIQKVYPLSHSNTVYLNATEDHKLYMCNEKYIYQDTGPGYSKRPIKEIRKDTRVRKAYCTYLIQGGNKTVPNTYILGAMLGNRHCRENGLGEGNRQKNLNISSPDKNVPEKIASILKCTYHKHSEDNYVYSIIYGLGIIDQIPFYKEWSHNRYSYQKKALWKEVNTWDKQSALAFLAGVLDTGGGLDITNNRLVLYIFLQAKSVIECCSRIIFKYFQEKPNWDTRDKYKNGQIHVISISQNLTIKRILEELFPYLVSEKYKKDLSFLPIRQLLPDTIGFKIKEPKYQKTYDITVGNTTNLYILHHGGIVTSNSGKTEIIGKRKQVLRFLLCHDKRFPHFYSNYPDPKFFIGAPTRDQVKRIYWNDIKKLVPLKFLAKPPNESNLILTGKNGAELHLLGLDKPERIEGSPWDHGVVDEIGNVKPTAWQENIRPALSDRRGGCDFIGVPEGRNHYYKMAQKAKADKTGEWGYYHWISADILPPEEIEAARQDLDELVYQQEYEASFINFSGMAYYNYDEKLHVGDYHPFYQPTKPLVLCFDFNVAPGVAVILQELGPETFKIPIGRSITVVIDEVYIPKNSTTPRVCAKILEKYPQHPGAIICYGDATGGSKGSAKVRGSDWDLIKEELIPYYGNRIYFNVPKENPLERSRVNSLNSRLKSASGAVRLLIDQRCKYLQLDLEGVRVIEGSAGEIDKKKDKELTHISDALGYYTAKEFPVFKYWSAEDINEAMRQAT